MNGDGDDSGEKEPPPDEEKKVEGANVGEGQGSLKDDELKVSEEITIGGETGQGSWETQHHHQQSQGTPFCWERFLHIRTIKVLLVENDDSTRHVVAALLRNCNYEVIEASNGLQAWKVLEDLTNHVDLILSEVVMPCVSGIGLLYKIMSHKSRKNIPVIMMSSHDSMGLVFKCLSKGAVDFLVKPIRKNELKNLWQHVWRRCHSSSGSGSESGSHTQKSVKSKSSEKSENHSGSNDKEHDGSNGLNIGDESDDESGAQSSWTKQPTEVDNSHDLSPVDQAPDCEDSTCAQVIYSNAEAAEVNQFQATGAGNCLPVLQPGKTVKHEVNRDAIEAASNHIGAQQDSPLEIGPCIDSNMKYESLKCHKSDYQSNDHQVVCTITSGPETELNRSGASLEHTDILDKINNIPENSEKPTVELSLKRLRGVLEAGKDIQDAHYILRHSELSAFSRYNAPTKFSSPNGIGITESSSAITKNLDGGRKELGFDSSFHSCDTPLYPSSKRGTNTVDIGSTKSKLLPSPLIFLSEATSTINGMHSSSSFEPVNNDVQCSTQQVNVVNQSDVQSTTLLAPARGSHQQQLIQQPHHHHHHHYHINHFDNLESDQKMSSNEELSLKKLAGDSLHCGSSNVSGSPGKANPLNYSMDRSASGSNYGSNGHNGSSNAVNAGGTNGESDAGINLEGGSGDANGSGCGNRLDQNRLAQREAALAKFRQKRKERCFMKRVRYQNRKRLAEMRPRVRGQFVSQTEQDNSSSNEADEH